ncbi:uncharacterized protein LOC120255321 [Dioscorea cayenensis subsp. rotundata]|uniref:Uncharacterized protein LOC120255321 n=1 Tax=Dioscorea cayennensis subsp. rotundata TaxID=55577 RepID=A0AB40AVP0_DIOCR|nr:uncharacterized protein LOC120255321 [Dioscorea cayenensis subsp. rotundata]
MGQHGGWAPPGGLQPNGLLSTDAAGVTRVLDEERWSLAEERTAELIACIQPNRPSEERRNAVADYVRRLIMNCFPCQVSTFGSVPLKTYLPDGDIDLTAFSKNENLKDTWAITVRDVLQNEEKNENAEFHVKEVQYIQAEVKIVKCLVENIVVDISFNQVGGLCTLCFLEEIDHLINHNHLFKRSIILIKAWCYYESRILGAHHGLISTYALETLVLYIFHVFNNSFAGPLEVLYRFLEFFSNFDWDKFCVSLWGPVPVNSLPDMIAEPPRNDGGELLLSKGFLDSCSMVYAVFPGGQESQGQPFISKHFNVIDPLRINNNLGRSVSKGNFFRIRSAFSFGAKRLAKLVHCPKENLIAELNQFFMNTWERHGSGNRPDAPSPSLCQLQPSKSGSQEESNNSRSTSSIKKNSERLGPVEYQAEGSLGVQARTSQIFKNIRQQSANIVKTSAPSASYSPIQQNISNPSNTRASDKVEKSTSSRGSSQAEKNQKNSRPVYPLNDLGGQARFQFARTRSSPELIDSSAEVSFGGNKNKVPGTGKDQIAHTKSEYSFGRKESSYEASGCHSGISSDDPSSLRQISPHKSLRSSDLDSVSSDYQDVGFTTVGGDLGSVAEAIELQQELDQEQQDLINLGASSSGHNFSGPIRLPLHFSMPHLPIPLPPSLASLGCAQRNLASIYPTNFPLIDPAWAPKFDFSHALISSQFSHAYPTSTLSSNSEEIESGNESCSVPEINHEDNDHFWHEHVAGSNRGFELDAGGFHRIVPDDQKQPTLGFLDSVASLQVNNSGAPFVRGHHKFAREEKELATDDFTAFHHQTSRTSENNANERTGNSRSLSGHQPGSSRNKSASENSWDGSSIKASKPVKDRRGRKPSSDATSVPAKTKSGWQHEDSLDLFSAQADDEASPRSRSHQSPGYESAEIAGADSMISISPLVSGSQQKLVNNNTGVVPIAFYPTGPPVPFLTMVPVYNFPSEAGNSNGPTTQVDNDELLEHGHVNSCDQNFDAGESLDQFEAHLGSAALRTAPILAEEHKADILNSDFASHWQSLQYGRFCQSTRQQGPLIYSSNAPPVYLQGHFPWDGPGRPFSSNGNLITQIGNYGPRLVPVTALQPGPRRNSGVQRFAEEIPRYRRGTGTYLPNPKSFRDRQSSNTRNHRGNQNFDQRDRSDRESSWINSKSRNAGRSYGRPQAEKPSLQSDRLSATDNRSDKTWNSYRHEPITSYNSHTSSFRSSNPSNSSSSTTYGSYQPLPALNANGASPTGPALPPFVMLYPFNQGVGYGSPAEQLEFGSIGSVSLSSMNEVQVQPNEGVSARGAYDQRQNAHFGGSSRSSPDRPSSPLIPRSR